MYCNDVPGFALHCRYQIFQLQMVIFVAGERALTRKRPRQLNGLSDWCQLLASQRRKARQPAQVRHEVRSRTLARSVDLRSIHGLEIVRRAQVLPVA